VFRTEVATPRAGKLIRYGSKALFIGSCFTRAIGDRLNDLKFKVKINPFGVQYNPVSIENSLRILMDARLFNDDDLQFQNELWFSYDHHTSFSDPDKGACLASINASIEDGAAILKEAGYIFITFGTSWVYALLDSKRVVSNCHKQPAKVFTRYRLRMDDIIKAYQILIKDIRRFNPDINVVFTVSPIRHLKDGAEENQVSKSTLILVVRELTEQFDNVGYFPAYEIMMDDLRDYRFYEDDMIHPNLTAQKYIWDRFSQAYLSDSTNGLMRKIEKLKKAMRHRPFNPESSNYKEFVNKNLIAAQQLAKENISIDLTREISFFRSML